MKMADMRLNAEASRRSGQQLNVEIPTPFNALTMTSGGLFSKVKDPIRVPPRSLANLLY